MTRYQLKPQYFEAFQWYPGVTHPRIYSYVMPGGRTIEERIDPPTGALRYTCGDDAEVILTDSGSVWRVSPGDWIVIHETSQYLTVLPEASFHLHYVAVVTQQPAGERSRVVSI